MGEGFGYLLLEAEDRSWSEWSDFGKLLRERTLRYFAPIILRYDGYYWNDEREDWFKYSQEHLEQMEWFVRMGLSDKDSYYGVVAKLT